MLHTVLQAYNANAYVPLVLAVASASALWWLQTGVTRSKIALLLAVLLTDLLGVATTFNRTMEPEVFQRVPPSVQFLQNDPDLFRVASFVTHDQLSPAVAQSQLAISWALPYGIDEINGFNSLQPRRYTDVLWGPEREDVSYGFLNDRSLLDPNHRLLAMLGVKYVLVQPQTRIVPPAAWERVFVDTTVSIYRNPNWRGRAIFADWVVALPTTKATLASVRQLGFDGTRIALTEGELERSTMQRLSDQGPAEVQVERLSPNELHIRTRTDAERFLILSEMWFPGWHAELEDGTSLKIHRTNYLLRGLVVPPGEHTIRMVYQPTSVIAGALITAGTMGALVGGGVWRRVRRVKKT
jgi:hypothetical protein